MKTLTSILLDINSCKFDFTSAWTGRNVDVVLGKATHFRSMPTPRPLYPVFLQVRILEKLTLKLI